METNLGDMLVEAGKITSAQLDEALKCQVIFGGRIGTNLIELGYLNENELAYFLSQKLRVPAADPHHLMNLPPDLVDIIPRDIVEKFKVVPYSLDKKRLNLVMIDPLNLAAIDEISFRTGYIIIPMVAPEVRIFCALEKYYEIKREMRYINVSQSISRHKTERKEPSTEVPQSKGNICKNPTEEEPATAAVLAESGDLEFSSVFEGFHTLPGDQDVVDFSTLNKQESLPKLPVAGVASPPAAFSATPPLRAEMSAGESAIAAVHPETAIAQAEGALFTLDDFALALAESRDREEIAEALMKYLGQQFTRCALFRVRGNNATGWRAIVKKRPIEDFEELQIDFSQPSALKLVTEGKSFYLGAMLETVNNRLMLAAMGSGTLPTALLLPLLMMGRVVAVLYVDGEQAILSEKLPELQKIVAKAALAFEILILRTKILVH